MQIRMIQNPWDICTSMDLSGTSLYNTNTTHWIIANITQWQAKARWLVNVWIAGFRSEVSILGGCHTSDQWLSYCRGGSGDELLLSNKILPRHAQIYSLWQPSPTPGLLVWLVTTPGGPVSTDRRGLIRRVTGALKPVAPGRWCSSVR